MRKIKFRTWDGSTMDYDVAVGKHSKDSPDCKRMTCVQIDDGECWYYHEPPEAIMQFTGLTDKNGKEIYEGDICKGNGGAKDFYFEVGFEDGCFIGKMPWNASPELKHYIDMDFVSVEVIGNIHENPELLENP